MQKVIVIIILLTLFPISSGLAESFQDVPEDHWAYEAIETLTKEGIITGYPDGSFKGTNSMTRYEIVLLISRLIKFLETKIASSTQQTEVVSQKPPAEIKFQVPEGAYTGVVIDARELKISRSMSPRIIDKDGKEVYGPSVFQGAKISSEVFIEKGVVEYIRVKEESDINQALKESRAGKKPIIIKAIGISGPFGDDIIISPEDAEKLIKENKTSRFLENMAVVILH